MKRLCLVLRSWIKSIGYKPIKSALDRQRGVLSAEGFEVVGMTCDGESAIGQLSPELESSGCRISIHSPGTDSAEVDVKIKQIKCGVRAATNLPYLLPFVLLAYAVYYVLSKVNMLPNRSLAHGYSLLYQILLCQAPH